MFEGFGREGGRKEGKGDVIRIEGPIGAYNQTSELMFLVRLFTL
jgi:hypothetical protein